jgi:hypothetical protein
MDKVHCLIQGRTEVCVSPTGITIVQWLNGCRQNSGKLTIQQWPADMQTRYLHPLQIWWETQVPCELSGKPCSGLSPRQGHRVNFFSWLLNTLRTGRQFIGFWPLSMADRSPIYWLLGHAMLQHTISRYGATQTDKLCVE